MNFDVVRDHALAATEGWIEATDAFGNAAPDRHCCIPITRP
jgi:hypothetical protein